MQTVTIATEREISEICRFCDWKKHKKQTAMKKLTLAKISPNRGKIKSLFNISQLFSLWLRLGYRLLLYPFSQHAPSYRPLLPPMKADALQGVDVSINLHNVKINGVSSHHHLFPLTLQKLIFEKVSIMSCKSIKIVSFWINVWRQEVSWWFHK